MSKFQRLIRFEDPQGQVHYGELDGCNYRPTMDHRLGLAIFILQGSLEVLCPIPYTPIIIGVGLNYRKHAEEAGFPIPKYPVTFTKYADSLAGPYEDIPISEDATQLDFEHTTYGIFQGELCIIIGQTCKNLSPADNPLDYVLGYTAGNDISSRFWQIDRDRSGGQHGYAKSFDKFAPIGPVLCSTSQIPDPAKLRLKTTVNGVEKQNTGVDDLIFDVSAIIRHLTRGRTLRAGTVIMTGTPSGVAAFENPPGWLKDGDVVQIEISGIGSIENRMVFEY
ncbi:hypothetical protein OIDMADRAFT_106206 [Oidiodendron maius Zn]|uniref:Fumarylacetoacetase-like C-terminal domain-containing protein n=1 Tax=Oidiodendron maius (strain Zn) TaxID=913774 RepID=A0A0C3CB56_OIDMZ|nr:hypothetical protein OIDMADRAFT_106206 [Oidiodendron maius Zn]